MAPILLAVLCSTAVSLILKSCGHRGLPVKSVFLVNYLIASLSAAVQTDFDGLPPVGEALLFYLLALVLGLLFIGAFYIYQRSLTESGMYLSTTVSRLSTGLPLAGSILFFNESLTPYRLAGLAVMFMAIPLSVPSRRREPGRRASLWTVLLFFAFGINDFILKIVKELWPGVGESGFLFFVFSTSALTALVLMAVCKEPLSGVSILPGVALGLVNLGSALFVMKALSTLSAVVVYPTLSLGIITMGIVAGVLFWKEKLTLRHGLFTVLAGIALFFIR